MTQPQNNSPSDSPLRVLMVADEDGELPTLRQFLAGRLGGPVPCHAQETFNLEAAPDAVIMYIHRPILPDVETALIAFTEAGGRLLVLHHGLASAKLNNPHWLAFLGMGLYPRDHAHYPWKVGLGTHTIVNLAPGHYVTSHQVWYDRLAHYHSPNRPDLAGPYPAIDLPDTEVFFNQRLADGIYTDARNKTVLFGYGLTPPSEAPYPAMDDTGGWYQPAGQGHLFYLQAGHHDHDFLNPTLAQICLNCLMWQEGLVPEIIDPLIREAVANPAAPSMPDLATIASSQSQLERDAGGWIDLLPNADLTGWMEYPWPPGTSYPARAERLPQQWSVDVERAVLCCTGERHAHLLCHTWFDDFVLHVEFRYLDGELDGPNSGIFVRMVPERRVMHQIELKDSSAMLFGGIIENKTVTYLPSIYAGHDSDGWRPGMQKVPNAWSELFDGEIEVPPVQRPAAFGVATPVQRQPPGQWNTVEITCLGPTITVWMNGAIAAFSDQCQVASGLIGFEAEGYPIEFRNIKVQPR